jgi:glycosyltransferase involved in cell wall biosynthesis
MPPTERPVPLASVIVPVFEGAATLDACLEGLARQTVDPGCFEVIVVDDGSNDGSVEIARRYDSQVICQEHSGAAAARNLGATQAQGQILLFTDADCQPQPDWIAQMLMPFGDPEVAGVKGIYRTCQRSLVARFTQAEYEEKYERLARAKHIDFVDTHAAAYRREVFWSLGGFDPDFLLDEDQEFSFRVAGAGHKLIFAPAARVSHRHPTTVGRYVRRKLQLGRWKVRVHARHPIKVFADSYTPWTQRAQLVLLPLFGGSALAALLGFLSWLPAAVFAGLGAASTLPLLVKAREQGWSVALVAPPLVLARAAALDLGLLWGLAAWVVARLGMAPDDRNHG